MKSKKKNSNSPFHLPLHLHIFLLLLLTSLTTAENICWSSNMLSPTNIKPPWGFESKPKKPTFPNPLLEFKVKYNFLVPEVIQVTRLSESLLKIPGNWGRI